MSGWNDSNQALLQPDDNEIVTAIFLEEAQGPLPVHPEYERSSSRPPVRHHSHNRNNSSNPRHSRNKSNMSSSSVRSRKQGKQYQLALEEPETKKEVVTPWFCYFVIFGCLIGFIYEMSIDNFNFEPFHINPMLGPSGGALVQLYISFILASSFDHMSDHKFILLRSGTVALQSLLTTIPFNSTIYQASLITSVECVCARSKLGRKFRVY